MATVVVTPEAEADLGRLAEFLLKSAPEAALDTFDLVIGALRVLEAHPLIGRPADDGLRELLISRGKSGYIALYEFHAGADRVLVLAVRHQREAGYVDRDQAD
ncbi:MAG: type II toxin-antitoxin system RelE/ParE family toxin [Betaproteobacteria bacterium]